MAVKKSNEFSVALLVFCHFKAKHMRLDSKVFYVFQLVDNLMHAHGLQNVILKNVIIAAVEMKIL